MKKSLLLLLCLNAVSWSQPYKITSLKVPLDIDLDGSGQVIIKGLYGNDLGVGLPPFKDEQVQINFRPKNLNIDLTDGSVWIVKKGIFTKNVKIILGTVDLEQVKKTRDNWPEIKILPDVILELDVSFNSEVCRKHSLWPNSEGYDYYKDYTSNLVIKSQNDIIQLSAIDTSTYSMLEACQVGKDPIYHDY